MAYSEQAIAYAAAQLERRREAYALRTDKKLADIMADVPSLSALQRERRSLGVLKMKASLQKDTDEVKRLTEGLADVARRTETALAEKGYSPADLLPLHYCSICEDRGVLRDGTMCSCKRALISEYEAQRIAKASPLALCSFDSFSLDYYSDSVDAALGISSKENMQQNLEACREYAASFPNHRNLLLMGSAGLGKTHLALSIADALIRKGTDVIYCSCANIFAKIEQERADFSRYSETLQSMKQCSLLVLDDLGSEYVNASVNALLYDIINTRLSEGSSTIITTNLTDERLFTPRYGEKITSRLIGCFDILPFAGKDIRLQKNGY